ncbi:hypothetical protein GC170_07090 [bacterium]|nr:hypothetical protein [bacterium]
MTGPSLTNLCLTTPIRSSRITSIRSVAVLYFLAEVSWPEEPVETIEHDIPAAQATPIAPVAPVASSARNSLVRSIK